MIGVIKKLNTAITVVTTVYAVTKFMFKTFKKYEEKHGNNKKQKIVTKGTSRKKKENLSRDVQEI